MIVKKYFPTYVADTILIWVWESKFRTVRKIIAGERVVNTEHGLQLLVPTVAIPPVRLMLVMTEIV